MTEEKKPYSRRDFVKTVATTAAAVSVVDTFSPLQALATEPKPVMPTRPLGRTGHDVKIYSLGGQATLEQPDKDAEAEQIINRAIDLGINYIDTAAAYGRGISQTYIGRVMKTRRKEVYLATKTGKRDYDSAMKQLDESLKLLQTDHLDAWQMHNVRTQEDLDGIFAKDGVLKAMQKARDEKIVRFIGITGHHDPLILKKAIEQFPYDTILMALNAADKHHASFIDTLLPVAVEKKMGIIAMKIPARGRIFRDTGITSMQQALSYVLTLPVSTTIVGVNDVKQLADNVKIAADFNPLKKEEMAKLEDLTKPYYADASWFKTQW
jgi:aryl-alcohol dehydrogenase-like predicted oxidoreductase